MALLVTSGAEVTDLRMSVTVFGSPAAFMNKTVKHAWEQHANED